VKGISVTSFYTETFNYINTFAYSMHLGLAFSVYGESMIITGQNAIIILMIWNMDKSIGFFEKFVFAVLATGYAYALVTDEFLTEDAWAMITSSSILLNIASRVPQIYTNFANSSTGQLAFFTFFLSFLGTMARVATVMIESDDFMYRLQFLISLALNGIIVIQFLLYWNNTDEEEKKVQPDGETKKGK